MGVLYTLRAGSLVRLELARDIQSEGWALKRGTVFVGAVLGGELDRAYVQIKGFIDPDTQGFVRLEGELLGNDGGAGLCGKRRRVSSAWGKALDRLAQSGTQILTGILGRQGSSVIVATDPYGTYRSTNGADSSRDNRSFVKSRRARSDSFSSRRCPKPKSQIRIWPPTRIWKTNRKPCRMRNSPDCWPTQTPRRFAPRCRE
jgi:hypothetical protein